MDKRPRRDKKHDVSNDGKGTKEYHNQSAGFNLVRDESTKDHCKEPRHIWWHREKLGFHVAVAKT